MKKLMIVLTSLVCLLGFSFAQAATAVNIGVVDYAAVMKATGDFDRAAKAVSAKYASQQKQIAALQQQLKTSVAQFQKTGAKLSDADQQAAERKILGLRSELMSATQAYQSKTMSERAKAAKAIMVRVDGVIAKVAKKQKLDLVLSKASVPYMDSKFDITQAVIQALK